MAVEKA